MDWLSGVLEAGEHAIKIDSDLEYFAEHMLKIRPKVGGTAPLMFNPAQRQLHAMLEEQKVKTGRVRAIVLKARQMGISTYIAARFYKRTTANPGLRTLIIAHEKPASNTLFKLVKRFNDHMPDDHRPSVGISNAQELIFDTIDSGYGVSVATEEGSGRSDTAQSLHASEAAFWVDLDTQIAALMQTVPDMDNTEIIIETTANGYNEFHKLWRKAETGDSEYMPVFLPWSIDPLYRRPVPEDFTMTADEQRLAELHGLDAEQIAWRRNKLLSMPEELFCQEYPLTPAEAFIASNFDSYITPELVLAARRRPKPEGGPKFATNSLGEVNRTGTLIIGVDPAGKGADRTSIAWREGSAITKIESRRGLDTMEVAGLIAKIIREEKPTRVNIDVGGLGVGVADRLEEQGFGSVINRVNFGGKPIEPPALDENGRPGGGPLNRRAELYYNMKQILEKGGFSFPDSESLQGDLCSIGYKYNSEGRLVLESKEDMRRRGMPSPDEGDAVALCFSEANGSSYVGVSNFNRRIEYETSGYV